MGSKVGWKAKKKVRKKNSYQRKWFAAKTIGLFLQRFGNYTKFV